MAAQARNAGRRMGACRAQARHARPTPSCCFFPRRAEGIGINRVTQNFAKAQVDGAFKGSDREAVEMVRRALSREPCLQFAALPETACPRRCMPAQWKHATSPSCPSAEQAQYLLRNEGLFVGSSAAMNCVGAVKAARLLGPGHTIVTMLCDGEGGRRWWWGRTRGCTRGQAGHAEPSRACCSSTTHPWARWHAGGHRHLSKFHSPDYLAQFGLTPQGRGRGLEFVS